VFLVIASTAVIMSVTDPTLWYTCAASAVTSIGISYIGARYEPCGTPYCVAVEFIGPIITVRVAVTAPGSWNAGGGVAGTLELLNTTLAR